MTAVALSVLVLWITSYYFSFAMGAYGERWRGFDREETFIGLHSDAGQLGVGRTRQDRRGFVPATYPAGTQPAMESMEWVGGWRWRLEAGLPGTHFWFEWTGNAMNESVLARMGFNVSNIRVTKPYLSERKHAILMPWWAVFLVTCAVAVKWLFFRERRIYWGKVGRCIACGYDLRQSSQRCPECGERIPTAAAVAPSNVPESH